MNDRLTRIRESERKSHTAAYANENLYDKNSWLQKPIRTVLDILPLFQAYSELRVLDLGCGVGRNSICIAQTYQHIHCVIDCVDFLEIAIEKLQQNAAAYGVGETINGILKPIEEIPRSVSEMSKQTNRWKRSLKSTCRLKNCSLFWRISFRAGIF